MILAGYSVGKRVHIPPGRPQGAPNRHQDRGCGGRGCLHRPGVGEMLHSRPSCPTPPQGGASTPSPTGNVPIPYLDAYWVPCRRGTASPFRLTCNLLRRRYRGLIISAQTSSRRLTASCGRDVICSRGEGVDHLYPWQTSQGPQMNASIAP